MVFGSFVVAGVLVNWGSIIWADFAYMTFRWFDTIILPVIAVGFGYLLGRLDAARKRWWT